MDGDLVSYTLRAGGGLRWTTVAAAMGAPPELLGVHSQAALGLALGQIRATLPFSM